MTVRDANSLDFPSIVRIHAAMGSDYRLPELDHPLFIVRKVAEGPNGLSAACFLRISTECYLWLDPALNPRDKMRTMLELQPAVLSEAYLKGIDDIEARVPETLHHRFRKRLEQLGWQQARPGWSPWSRATQ